MRLLLVRHGETEWNATRRLQGHRDIALSDKGRRQADALRPVIEGIGPDRAISSDLQRVRETALRVGAVDPRFTEALREIEVGDWAGESIADLVARDRQAYLDWRAGKHTPNGGESWAHFTQRVCGVVEREQAHANCENLLVVCHGGVIRAVLQRFLSLQPANIIPVSPASLTALRLPNGADKPARLELFNYRPDTPELTAPD